MSRTWSHCSLIAVLRTWKQSPTCCWDSDTQYVMYMLRQKVKGVLYSFRTLVFWSSQQDLYLKAIVSLSNRWNVTSFWNGWLSHHPNHFLRTITQWCLGSIAMENPHPPFVLVLSREHGEMFCCIAHTTGGLQTLSQMALSQNEHWLFAPVLWALQEGKSFSRPWSLRIQCPPRKHQKPAQNFLVGDLELFFPVYFLRGVEICWNHQPVLFSSFIL